jgi:hypothetical protein
MSKTALTASSSWTLKEADDERKVFGGSIGSAEAFGHHFYGTATVLGKHGRSRITTFGDEYWSSYREAFRLKEPELRPQPVFFVTINGNKRAIPIELKGIKKSIDLSGYILDLEENWDDEGASAYTQETWNRAISFLVDFSLLVFHSAGKTIPAPQITHSVEGSIDIFWETDTFYLLVNVPQGEEPITYFGDDRVGNTSKGTISQAKKGFALAMSDLF